jgi:hypothetical protein
MHSLRVLLSAAFISTGFCGALLLLGCGSGVTQQVLLPTPTLAFVTIAAQTFGAAPFTVNASSASSGAVTYAVISGPATISGGIVTLTGTGTVVLSASQAATANYTAATASTSFLVMLPPPTLTFAAIATQTMGNAPFAVSATSISSGAVTYTVTSGPAAVSGNIVTLTGAGTVVLGATQAATAVYAAGTANTSFTVTQGTPALNFTAIATQLATNVPFMVSATSASTGAVTYTVASGLASITGSTLTLTGAAGTVILNASQAATANYATATANTSFTVPSSFSCVSANTGLFLLAKGGKAGSGGTINPALCRRAEA